MHKERDGKSRIRLGLGGLGHRGRAAWGAARRHLAWPIRLLICALAVAAVIWVLGIALRTGVSTNPASAKIDPAIVAKYHKLRNPVIDPLHPPVMQVDVDYSKGKAAAWYPKGESPILHKLVEQGKLPPVAQRVGPEPAVYRGAAGVGHYGGDFTRIVDDIDGVRLILQYELNSNTLTRFSPYGEPVRPHLAKKLTHSKDYKTWTVYLRQGVKWSDGVPFTADDIMFWWEHVANDPDMGWVPETMKSRGKPGNIIEVNKYELKFVFAYPNPKWPAMQAGPSGELFMAGPKHYLKQFHPTLGDQKLIAKLCKQLMISPRQLFERKKSIMNPERPSLSPWLFHTYSANGPWTAVRNPYYYAVDAQGNQLPYVDRIVFLPISPQLQAKAITDGVPSYAPPGAGDVDYSSLMAGRESGHYRVAHWYPSSQSRLLIVPNRRMPVTPGDPVSAQKAKLLQTPAFRLALSVAIDRKAIIDSAFKGVGRPRQLGPGPGEPWYEKGYGQANAVHDPARANAILDKLGLKRGGDGYRRLPGGQPLSLIMICSPGGTGALQFVVDDWRDVGLRVLLEEKPHRLYLKLQQIVAFAVANATPADSWGALGAGAPYWHWFYAGGMYDSEASRSPTMMKPDALERHAMQLGQMASEATDLPTRIDLARQVMAIAKKQVWTISLATSGPAPAMIKDHLLGVPPMLKSNFQYNTPGNGIPETWYWDDPNTINGVVPASASYLDQRQAAIAHEILHITPRPNATLARTGGGSWYSAGRIIQYLLLAIALAFGLLIILRHPFVLRRLIIMVPTLIVISIMVFACVEVPPGSYLDTVIQQMRMNGRESQIESQVARLKTMYHFDDSMVTKYLRWSGILWLWTQKNTDKGLLEGNLGRSMANGGVSVNALVGDRLLLTVCISLGTILFTWLIAIPIGVYSAVKQYSVGDYVLTVGGFIGMCIPEFVLALILMLLAKSLFGITINGLFSGRYAMQAGWDAGKVIDLMQHIWVPIIVVGAASTAHMIRVMRANLLDELRKPYVVTARAKGVRPIRLLFKYPFRLALNPFISGIGHLFPALVSGAAIVAIILSLPTVGPLLLNAVMLEDTYMAGSLLLCLSALSVFGVLVSDLLLIAVDPRIRMAGGTR